MVIFISVWPERTASPAFCGGGRLVCNVLQSKWRNYLVRGKTSQEPFVLGCSQRIPRWSSSHLRRRWCWRARRGTVHSLSSYVCPMGAWAGLSSSPAAVGQRAPGQLKVRKVNPISEYPGIQFISTGGTINEDLR